MSDPNDLRGLVPEETDPNRWSDRAVTTMVRYHPEPNLLVVILCNQDRGASEAGERVGPPAGADPPMNC